MCVECLYLPQSSRYQRWHDFVHLLRLYFITVWWLVLNQTQFICLCSHNPDYHFIKQSKDGLLQMHTYIHMYTTIWNIQNSLVNSRPLVMQTSWVGNVKASSLGVGGISLTSCRVFSLGGPAFGRFILVCFPLWTHYLTLRQCIHFGACTAYASSCSRSA